MVLHYEIEQHSSLFFNRGIKVFATESLVNLPNAAFEGVIFLVSKPLAATELHLQGVDSLHRILIGGTERFFFGCLLNAQCLIVVAVECVEGIYIIGYDIEKSGIFYQCF